jgi:hypothetical protein
LSSSVIDFAKRTNAVESGFIAAGVTVSAVAVLQSVFALLTWMIAAPDDARLERALSRTCGRFVAAIFETLPRIVPRQRFPCSRSHRVMDGRAYFFILRAPPSNVVTIACIYPSWVM